jgi:hypothetical protein
MSADAANKKRSRAEVQIEIDQMCEQIQEMKKKRDALKEELELHPDTTRECLLQWGVPESAVTTLVEEHGLSGLLVDHDPCRASKSVGAGTSKIVQEAWELQLRFEKTCNKTPSDDKSWHVYEATRWTGASWECDNFERLSEDDLGEYGPATLWEYALAVHKNDEGDCPHGFAIASMAFHYFVNH